VGRELPNKVTNDVFVGLLPYSCNEQRLFDLFGKYFNVIRARIQRTAGGETQLFGFVTLDSQTAVVEAVRLLNNTLFEGRKIK
jgi:RNA recognition motif-containing protein